MHDSEHQGFRKDHVGSEPAVSFLVLNAAWTAIIVELGQLMRKQEGAPEMPEEAPGTGSHRRSLFGLQLSRAGTSLSCLLAVLRLTIAAIEFHEVCLGWRKTT